MKIKMLTTSAGPEGSYQAGQELEVGADIPNKEAQMFVAGGFARVIGKAPPPAPPQLQEQQLERGVEMAVVEPVAEKGISAAAVVKGKKKTR